MTTTRTELLNKMRDEFKHSDGCTEVCHQCFDAGVKAADSMPDERVQGLVEALEEIANLNIEISTWNQIAVCGKSKQIASEALAKFKGRAEG